MRRFVPVATFVAIAAGALAAPSSAQEPSSDVRCMLVSNIFAKNGQNAQAKQIASSAMLFYGGRVAQLPSARIKSALAAETKAITPATAVAMMNSCAQRMNQSLNMLQALAGTGQQKKP